MAPGGLSSRPRVDVLAECIWRDGKRFTVTPKAFKVLRCLMDRPEQLLTKEELLDAVWPGSHVIDKVLNIAVSDLRQALDDDPKHPRFIATVHRRGFRWVGPPAPSVEITAEEDSGIFVGRADALAELERRHVLAAGGRRQIVFVTGEAGIGKSMLLERFLRSLGGDAQAGPWIARGQCVDRYRTGESYRPLLDATETMVRDTGPPLVAIFRKHAPSWLLRMRDVVAPGDLDEMQRAAGDSSIERMQRELERALVTAAGERTVVLVLDDLHWSDLATVGFLAALAAGREAARLLVLCTVRPVDALAHQHPIVPLKRDLLGKRQCSEIVLDGLSEEAVGSFLDQHFSRHRLPDTLTQRLHAQTSGNPLFLVNAVADLVQRGWIREQNDVWHCDIDLDTLAQAVPDGTRDLIGMRVDVLPASMQELLEAASVCGMRFTTQALAAAIDRVPSEVEADCARLTHTLLLHAGAEVLWPDGTRGRRHEFRHVLYRHVLEERIAPSRRQHLHQRIAARLENGYASCPGEVAATLRFHFEQAGDLLRAVDCIQLLVSRSFARRAMHEVIQLQEDGVRLLEQSPPGEAVEGRLRQMRIALGFSSTTTVGSTDARSARAISDGESFSMSPRTSPEHLVSLASVATGLMAAGEYQKAHAVAGDILALDGGEWPEAQLAGHSFFGLASYYLGDIRAALSHFGHTARLSAILPPTRIGDASTAVYDPAVPALGIRAQALTLAGRAQQGEVAIEAALSRARTIDMPWYVGWVLSNACFVGVLRREAAVVRRRAAQLEEHCGDGQEHLQAIARYMRAWAAVTETGERELLLPMTQALEQIMNTPDPMVASRYYSMMADGQLRAGEHASAAESLERAERARGANGYYVAQLQRQRAAVAIAHAHADRRQAPVEAETELEAATQTAAEQGAHLLSLRALVDLTRLHGADGKSDPVKQRLQQALACFEEAFEDADLREAREVLGSP